MSNGQILDTPLITDRPDQAESAETILLSYFQIETGFLYNKNNTSVLGVNNEIKSYDIASTLVRIGLSSRVELRIESGYLSEEILTLNKKETISGFRSLNIGTKIRLVNNPNSAPNISAIINFKLPVGKNSFKPQNIEPEVIFIFAKDLSHIFTLSVNVGSEWKNTENILGYFFSLALGISLTDKIGTYIEYFGNASTNVSLINKFDTGFTYLIKNNIQYDVSGGLDINTGTSDWFISTGLSFRLPN